MGAGTGIEPVPRVLIKITKDRKDHFFISNYEMESLTVDSEQNVIFQGKAIDKMLFCENRQGNTE